MQNYNSKLKIDSASHPESKRRISSVCNVQGILHFVQNDIKSLLTFNYQKGQALTTLLFFVIIAVTITSAAVIMIISNAISTGKVQGGITAYYAAESGIEDALMRLLRDPNSFSGGTETLSIEGTSSTAEVSVTDITPTTKEVIAVGQNGNFKRTVQAHMTYSNGYYTFTNWKEI